MQRCRKEEVLPLANTLDGFLARLSLELDRAEEPWVRVPDFTIQQAFSCPTAHVRLVGALRSTASSSYLQEHRNVVAVLNEVNLSVPGRARAVELARPACVAPWSVVPEPPTQLGHLPRPWERLSCAAAYTLAALKHAGHLRARDVPQFVERIIALDSTTEPAAERFSDEWVEVLAEYISELLPRYEGCNDGTLALAALAQIEAYSGAHAAASCGEDAAERVSNSALGIVQRERDIAARQQLQFHTRRSIVTPTRVVLLTPSLDDSNRILRQCALYHYTLQAAGILAMLATWYCTCVGIQPA